MKHHEPTPDCGGMSLASSAAHAPNAQLFDAHGLPKESINFSRPCAQEICCVAIRSRFDQAAVAAAAADEFVTEVQH